MLGGRELERKRSYIYIEYVGKGGGRNEDVMGLEAMDRVQGGKWYIRTLHGVWSMRHGHA